MARVLAYCAGCDSEVEVDLERLQSGPLTADRIHCPHDDLCRPRDCVLARVPEDQWLDYLEFLPGRDDARHATTLEESGRIVEMGRRTSLARELRRWILWWR